MLAGEHCLIESAAHCRKSLPCCRERPLGGLPLFRLLGDREDRQQAVTDELQYLAAMALDRDRLRVEDSVEHGDDAVVRKPVGELREAAQIGRPEDRFDLFTGTASDLAGEDPRPCRLAEI